MKGLYGFHYYYYRLTQAALDQARARVLELLSEIREESVTN